MNAPGKKREEASRLSQRSETRAKCAKCGSRDVSETYVEHLGNYSHPWTSHARLHIRQDEHIDHHCCTCGFEWEVDCLDVQEARRQAG